MEDGFVDKDGNSTLNYSQSETCPFCGTIVNRGSKFCINCGSELNNSLDSESTQVQVKEDSKKSKRANPRYIKETKCTCNSCGNVFYYGKTDVLDNTAKLLDNAGKEAAAASCCYCNPFIDATKTKNSVRDFSKCPKCGSKNITKEQITHEI